jgi:hypothetical protein
VAIEWDYFDMDSETRIPVTAVVFSAAAILLSGCIAYDAASTVVGAGTTVVGTGISVVSGTGSLVLSPVTGSEDDKDKSK